MRIPLGAIEFSPTDVAIILAVLVVGATLLATPATLLLAWVGARRATEHPVRAAVGYWFAGTALCLGATALGASWQLGWWAVPAAWVPTLLVAAVLNPRSTNRKRARVESTMTTRQQGER